MTSSHPALDEVLYAFALEGSETGALARYLAMYPQYSEELLDLSAQLRWQHPIRAAELSSKDEALIDAAWARLSKNTSPRTATNPLASLTPEQSGAVAEALGVKRQVLKAFRDHKVLVETVPAKFLQRLAEAVESTVETIKEALMSPPTLRAGQVYKSEVQPTAKKVGFEQLLIEAGHSESERAILLSDSD